MMTKEIDVLDVEELLWVVPMNSVSEYQIIEGLHRGDGNYQFISIEVHDHENYLVNLSVVAAFEFETIKELVTDCQYRLERLFDFTLQNSFIVPFVEGEIYDCAF